MKFSTGKIAASLLVIALSMPALTREASAAAPCKPTSTSGKCLLPLIAALQSQVGKLEGQVATLLTALTAVQNNHALALGPFVSVDANTENGVAGPNIIFSGANVHIESGAGSTFAFSGLGNLIIGYDEDSLGASTIDANRTGSHNLILGADHQFPSIGTAIFGFANLVSDNAGSITGGNCNAAGSTVYDSTLLNTCANSNVHIDSVSGGEQNYAHGGGASVSGGSGNTASFQDASVSGGSGNTASASDASVSGGASNAASGLHASVSGGLHNNATVDNTTVSGGYKNTASAEEASVSGGESNTASGNFSSILGGNGVTVSATDGHSP